MMRFAMITTDRYLGVFEALVHAGWQPVKLFTVPNDNKFRQTRAVVEYAQRLSIEVQFSRLTENDLEALAKQGCDALVVASYDWRIPDWQPYLKYAINFHPSLLPDDRGPYPLIPAILQQREVWGVTCHKVVHAFDAGDILDGRPFPVAADECHESLDLKIQMAAKQLAHRVAIDFIPLWNNAKAQGQGSYDKLWSEQDRTLDFSQNVADIMRQTRAFGPIECLATISDTPIYVKRAVGWAEPHQHAPGNPVHIDGISIVVAAQDGYIAILEWSLVDPKAPSLSDSL